MKADRVLEIGDRTYPIVYSQNAQYALDMYVKENNTESVRWFAEIKGEDDKKSKIVERPDGNPFEFEGKTIIPYFRRGSGADLVDRVISLQGSAADIHLFFWAILEGGRIKHKTKEKAFTVQEVGELIDEAGGLLEVSRQLNEALKAAVPTEEETGDRGNEQTGGQTSAARGTSKPSSKKRKRSASKKKRSGTSRRAS